MYKYKVLLIYLFLFGLVACSDSHSSSISPTIPDENPTSQHESNTDQNDENTGLDQPEDSSPALPPSCCDGEIRIGSFNLESGNADIDYLLNDIRKFGQGVDVWGFQEVASVWQEPIVKGLGRLNEAEYRGIMSLTGNENRLMIAYNAERLHLDAFDELDEININGRVRSPLVAMFTEIDSGLQFIFVNNHLYRGSESSRHEQARRLNDWGRVQNLPTIAVGDYNFDWELHTERRDMGFDLLTSDNVFVWVKPRDLIKTQCSGQFNSILDFIFLAGKAQSWQASSKIKFPEPDYCIRNPWGSDHRPVTANLLPRET
ncbi:MAG: endonuclease/exonuclease/phosphatase family protein [Oligoflexus sp.]